MALFMILNMYVFPRQKQAVQPEPAVRADSVAAADSLASQAKPAPAVADTLFQPAAASQTVILESERIKASFSTRGASITSVEMKDFFWADKKRPVDLVPEKGSLAGIQIMGSAGTTDLRELNWQHKVEPDSARVVFYLGDAANPSVVKTYTLDGQFGIKMDVQVNYPQPVNGIEYDFSAGIADSEIIKDKYKDAEYKFILYQGNDIQKTTLAKMRKALPGGPVNAFGWAALRSKYFTIALAETGNQLIRNVASSINPATGNPGLKVDSWDKTPSSKWQQSFLIYAGPSDYDTLKSYAGKHLELIPERGAGWYRWLTNMIAWLLKFLHKLIPNYGIVIIIFSIILKILLHPLTHKSMDSSLKMQRIQPQIQEIQKKYKNDPKTMQMELSKLYKEAGTNPFSGCLPLLLQMPIFFALYTVLRYTIDMRNASFVGWLSNLSEPDPYWILPIVMALFMILQSLMMRPSAAAIDQMDEKQKAMQQSTKMMTWLMPVMMFFIFKSLPSGLVLYYTVFNILSVAQQYYLQKHLKTKDIK